MFASYFLFTTSLSLTYHWIYASQYLKTRFLTSGIVNRAVLLFQRHKTVIENSYETTSQWSDFVSSHSSIDAAMKHEKARAQKIDKIFLFIDIILMALIPTIGGLLLPVYVGASSRDWFIRYEFFLYLYGSGSQVIFSTILALSACIIASQLTKSTGKKQNACLITCHVINMFLLVATTALVGILFIKVG